MLGSSQHCHFPMNVSEHLRRVFVKVVNVKDLLGILKPHLAELRIETGVLGAEVRNSETGGNLKPLGSVAKFPPPCCARKISTNTQNTSCAAKAGGAYTCARDNHNVLALLQEKSSIFYCRVLRQTTPLGELAGNGDSQQLVVGAVRGALQECGGFDAKSGTKLLGGDFAGGDGLENECAGAYFVQALPVCLGFFDGANVGTCRDQPTLSAC